LHNPLILLASLAFVITTYAAAEPISEMSGEWTGSGWAKQATNTPEEAIRCRLNNAYNAESETLTVAGRCAVAGKQLTMNGALQQHAGSERITGRWSNPEGIGSVRIVGIQRGNIVAFTFRTTDPKSGQIVSQNIEWRISDGTMRLRSTDRANPLIMMSDITFKR
jgi:hypothetical protein